MRATNIPSLHTRTNIFCSVHTTQASLTLVFWFYKEPSKKEYKFYLMNPLSLCRIVNEVLPPSLDSTSEHLQFLMELQGWFISASLSCSCLTIIVIFIGHHLVLIYIFVSMPIIQHETNCTFLF